MSEKDSSKGSLALQSINARYIDKDASIDSKKEARLVRKIDAHLLPIFIALYLLSFLDRSNIGNAKITGLVPDLHISTTNLDYNATLAIYFVGYVLFEVPSNIILKRFTPKVWLPTIMISWGIVSCLMGLSQTFGGLLAARFFLGVTEAGLFPGVVYLISQWYKREEQHIRISLFFSAASLAGAFGGILAYGIGKMDGIGGKHGWSWIFILEGLLTVVIALAGYFFVPNYPATTSWLTEEEKTLQITRLSRNSDAARDEKFNWSYVFDAFRDWQTYGYCVGFFSFSLPLYSFSLFLPTIIADLGFTSAKAQLLTVPTYTVAFLYTFGIALLSYKYKMKAIFSIISAVVAIVGYIILLATSNIGGQYFGTFLIASGVFGGTGIVLSWPATNLSGQLKRAVGCAMQIGIGDIGAIIGVLVYRPKDSPRYVPGHIISIAFLALGIVSQGALWWLLRRENRLRATGGRDDRLKGEVSKDEEALLLRLGDQHPSHRFQL